jgi:hypothetical protein
VPAGEIKDIKPALKLEQTPDRIRVTVAHFLEPALVEVQVVVVEDVRGRLPGSSWNFDGGPTGVVMVRR